MTTILAFDNHPHISYLFVNLHGVYVDSHKVHELTQCSTLSQPVDSHVGKRRFTRLLWPSNVKKRLDAVQRFLSNLSSSLFKPFAHTMLARSVVVVDNVASGCVHVISVWSHENE